MVYIQMIVSGFQTTGSWCQWLILFMGFGCIGLIVERFYYIVIHSSIGRQNYLNETFRILKTGDFQKALKFSSQFGQPIAKVFTCILLNKDKGEKEITAAIDEVFLTEVPRLQRFLPLMMILANVATLLGLLGTIFGLMLAFDAVANVPAAQRAAKLAEGIMFAMSTTAFGLCVAIPTMIIYGVIAAQCDRIIEELDEKSTKLINIVVGVKA